MGKIGLVADIGNKVATEKSIDLLAFARARRLRIRNLHDGRPVPPARLLKPNGSRPAGQTGYVGECDRLDAVVGFNGYLVDEGNGRLGIYLCYRSLQGVKKAEAKIRAWGGTVTQSGSFEVGGTIPGSALKDALRLIRVSKLAPGNPNASPPARSKEPYSA